MMRLERSILALSVITCCAVTAQDVETALREGNRHFRKDSLGAAARHYEQAASDERGVFNWGVALYRQQQFDQAQQKFESAAAMSTGSAARSRAFHNLGNSLLEQKKPEDAIKAYKEALKLNPDDEDTRYNLAYAQKLLRQQQQQQQQNKEDEKKEDQEKKDDQQQKQQDQEQQKKDQEQQQDQEQKEQKEQEQQQQQPPRQGQIDPKDAERILDALNRQEQNVQEKVRAKQRVAVRVPIEKDW